jgi:hypothetical protein
MCKRPRQILGLLVILTLTGMFVAVLSSARKEPNHQITMDSFSRVTVGMTLQEVEDIFQSPPRIYRAGRIPELKSHYFPQAAWPSPESLSEKGGKWRDWAANDLHVTIFFDSDDTVVCGRSFVEPVRVPESFLSKLRRTIGL